MTRYRGFKAWLPAGVFFCALLAAGLLLYRDYGIAWDEPTQVELGVLTYRYVMKGIPDLLSFSDRYYGPFFESLLVVFQARGEPQAMYASRHLLTFLSFVTGCVAFYLLAWRLFRSHWLALAGCAFLVLSPRIFADAFYNSKDIPFLALYTVSLLTLVVLLDLRHAWLAALHGIVTAALVATRLPGLVMVALTAGGLLIEVLSRRMTVRRAAALAGVYLTAALPASILFWPALWPDPLGGLAQAFRVMQNFPHSENMLYFGQTVNSYALPWHYIPAWIAITTPYLYLALFAAGLLWLLGGWLRRPERLLSAQGRNQALVLAALLVPLAAVIALRSTLYDGWRQMYFLYPPLLLLALHGLESSYRWLSQRLSARAAGWAAAAVLLAGILPVGVWMAGHHPYENLYFNRLAGPDLATIQTRFPLDYWGLTYKAGLAFLLQYDPSQEILFYAESAPGQRNVAIFKNQDAKRLIYESDFTQARYYIADYSRVLVYPFHHEIFTVRVDGVKVLSVYQMTDEEKH